jgi:Flp pilus assembly protein TadG
MTVVRSVRARMRRLADEDGSAIAEFVMVAALLTVLTLSVIQLGLALLVRNTALDAAAEGARFAALADNTLADGQARTHDLIVTALGNGYARNITARYVPYLGQDAVAVTVRTPLPLLGLIGLDSGLEVTGHAAVETLDGVVTRG